jgi:hypothetical protein
MGDSSNLWGWGAIPTVPRQKKWWEAVPGVLHDTLGAVAQARKDALQRQQWDAANSLKRDQLGLDRDKMTVQADELAKWHALQQQDRTDRLSETQLSHDRAAALLQSQQDASPVTGALGAVKELDQEPEIQGIASTYRDAARQAQASGSVNMPLDQVPLGVQREYQTSEVGQQNPALAHAFARGITGGPGVSRTMSPGQFQETAAPDMADALAKIRARQSGDRISQAKARPYHAPEDPEMKALRANLFTTRDKMLQLAGPGGDKMVDLILAGAMPEQAGVMDQAKAQQMAGLAQAYNYQKKQYTQRGGADLWGTPNAVPFQMGGGGGQPGGPSPAGGPQPPGGPPRVTLKIDGGEWDPAAKRWITQPEQ